MKSLMLLLALTGCSNAVATLSNGAATASGGATGVTTTGGSAGATGGGSNGGTGISTAGAFTPNTEVAQPFYNADGGLTSLVVSIIDFAEPMTCTELEGLEQQVALGYDGGLPFAPAAITLAIFESDGITPLTEGTSYPIIDWFEGVRDGGVAVFGVGTALDAGTVDYSQSGYGWSGEVTLTHLGSTVAGEFTVQLISEAAPCPCGTLRGDGGYWGTITGSFNAPLCNYP